MVRQSVKDRDELAEYFRQVPEVWEGCDPVKWWGARQAQFPNLCRFACDIMTIPGELYVYFPIPTKTNLHQGVPWLWSVFFQVAVIQFLFVVLI